MSAELARADLLSYMKAAIDLETQLMTQEQTLDECCAEIELRKPALYLERLTHPRPQPIQRGFNDFNYPLGIVCIIAGVIFFFILLGATNGEAIPSLIFGGIFFVPGVLLLLKLSSDDANVDRAIEEYDAASHEIKQRNQKRKEEHNAAIIKCNSSVSALRDAAPPRITETKALLEKLYAKGHIYQKYCNLPALTSIYEYFVTGRCTELAGPHGAYNLYESELRADTIINQLNVVIANLEQIRNNQYMLYQQVSAIQENTRAITRELRTISGYTIAIAQLTALNAYYDGVALRQAEIAALYDL